MSERVSLVRVENEWHVFTNTKLASRFYDEWRQYRDCEFLAELPVDASVDPTAHVRLEELRAVLRSQSMSWGELAELQGLAPYIADGDVELLEAAGVPEETARKEGRIY